MLLGEPFGVQSSQREQERRILLQRERSEEMRRFLASQAANTHPRLARILKKNQIPATSITEARPSIQLPHIKQAERRTSGSVSPSPNRDSENRRESTQNNPLFKEQQQANSNNYEQSRYPFYGYPFQPTNPYQTNYQFPLQYHPYQPNPYLPPINQFPGFEGPGYNQSYSATPFSSSIYPMPPVGQTHHNMYSQNQEYRHFDGQGQPPQLSRRSTDRERELQHTDNSEIHHFGRRQDNHQSKEQYAAELERQIKEKEERKRKERNYRSLPENGFLGDSTESPKHSTHNNGYKEGMGNIGFEGQNHNRSQQQSLYLRELDEQIRIKKEMQMKERVRHDSYIPAQPHVYPSEFMEGRRGSRKQFPTETAKIFNSMVFPSAQHASPLIGSRHVPLPNIPPGRNSYDNLPSAFPPRNSSESPVNLDLGVSNFVRGATHVSNMVGWQKDEFMAKQDQKRKNQLEIQDALKQQIAQKEFLKRKKIADERAEDEKERDRLEKEQAMLKERYQKEKEEARLKEEQELKEKQAAIEAKNAKKKQVQEETLVPQKAKKVFRRPSPEPLLNPDPQPFRSNSPPLPAVLKKMKEDGLEYIPPTSLPLTESQNETSRVNSSQSFQNEEMQNLQSRGVTKEKLEDKQQSIPSRPASKLNSKTPSYSKIRVGEEENDSNRQLLEQLEAIQRELQNEDAKVRNDIQNSTAEAVQEYDKGRFESELSDIGAEISKEFYRPSIKPSLESMKIPLPPNETKTARFKRYRDIVTPQSISQTPIPFDLGSRKTLDADSQLINITKNIPMLNHHFSSFPPESHQDLFNIDEIEKRNEARLKRLQSNYGTPTSRNGDELIARFMARQNSGDRSIPTSPSTFHPIPFDQIEL